MCVCVRARACVCFGFGSNQRTGELSAARRAVKHDNTHLVSCLSHFNFTYMEICKCQCDQTDVLECVCEWLRRRTRACVRTRASAAGTKMERAIKRGGGRGCRVNGKRDINSQEQKQKMTGEIRREIQQQQQPWERWSVDRETRGGGGGEGEFYHLKWPWMDRPWGTLRREWLLYI